VPESAVPFLDWLTGVRIQYRYRARKPARDVTEIMQ
jgi:hypothetical protein